MKQIDRLIDGYFEGTLTQREEIRLKTFLASEEGQAPEYDEVRAVVSYYAVGKGLGEAAYSRRTWVKVAAAAACLVMAVSIGMHFHNVNNVCIAYMNGEKVTDREVVMNDVENTLADLLSCSTDVEEQLNDFFAE